jgi:hypothetical protein
MLPDFPTVRKRVEEVLNRIFEEQVVEEQRTKIAKPYVLKEGSRAELRRSDGSIERVQMQQMRSKFTLDRRAVEDQGMKAVVEALCRTAADMAEQQMRLLFKRIEETATEAGMTYDASGQPLSMGVFLKGLEKLEIDFTPDGRPQFPTVYAGKTAFQKLATLKISDEEGEEFKSFIERKRLEWRDREGRRKLVG